MDLDEAIDTVYVFTRVESLVKFSVDLSSFRICARAPHGLVL